MLEAWKEWVSEYEYMDYSFVGYLTRIVLPFSLLSLAMIVLGVIFPEILSYFRFLLYGLAGSLIILGIVYPKIWASTRRKKLEQNLHLFITHFGVLAETGMERSTIFQILAKKKEEFGPLADIANQLNTLVNVWNQSLDQACRQVAQNTPSEKISDFLERMAHSVEAGQELDQFVMEEQKELMSDYEAMYKESLETVMEIRDLFTSILLAVVFLVVFSVLIPVISGISPLFLLSVAISVFIASEAGFLLATEFVLPDDPIWGGSDFTTSREIKMGIAELVGILGFVGLSIFSISQLLFQIPFSSNPLPLVFYIGVPLTPLAVPGVMAWLEEKKIIDRNNHFPNFIRSLGTIAHARQTTLGNALSDLKEKDFSELTGNIQSLYKRLQSRIEEKKAWSIFSSETGSFLIWKFVDMYFEGVENGGNPKQLSELISDNFKEVIRIRKGRYARAGNIMGMVYGMTVGIITAIFIGYFLTTEMIDVIGSALTGELEGIFSLGVYDIPGTYFLLLLMVLTNALVGALFIRSAKGGHELLSFLHFTILLWFGLLVGKVVEFTIGGFLAI